MQLDCFVDADASDHLTTGSLHHMLPSSPSHLLSVLVGQMMQRKESPMLPK